MSTIKHFLNILMAVMASSCCQTGVGRIPVKLVRPGTTVSLDCDTGLEGRFPEVLRCFDLQVVNDTILILRQEASEDNPFFFAAYSTRTLDYLGSVIPNGRGPGEMLAPHIMKVNSDEQYLKINDNQLQKAFFVDVANSVHTEHTSMNHAFAYPANITLDIVPLSGLNCLSFGIEDNAFVYNIVDADGKITKSFSPYADLDAMRSVTHMSSMFASNPKNGTVAEVLVDLPQIVLINAAGGEIRSVAVDKAYRKWKQFLNSMLGMDTITYHAGIASTSRYIFTSYWGKPIRRTEDSDLSSSIHIHDWTGKFLYKIRVKEDIGQIAFDEKNASCTV